MMLSGIQEDSITSFPDGPGKCHFLDDDHSEDVSINIKRTFIELVATPRHARRLRSFTDTDLLSPVDDACTADVSDASTDTPSDTEELSTVEPPQFAEWASPAWGPSEDEFYSNCTLDPFALPAPTCEVPLVSWSPHWTYDVFGQLPKEDSYQYENAHSGIHIERHFEQVTNVDVSRTTIMLRNLPPQFTRAHLIELLQDEGFEGSYDLVYVPMNFSGRCCLGYGFVNFHSSSDASRGWQTFNGFCNWRATTSCEVVWSDPHQGIAELIKRYRNSPVMHESVPEDWKPAYFIDGVQVAFPAPTETIKAPKQKVTRSRAKREHR